MTTKNDNTRRDGVCSIDCSALSAGDVVQRGDLFQANDGRLLEMDNLGRLLGIRVLGQTLKKGGDWFRPLPNAEAGRTELARFGQESGCKEDAQ